MSRADVIIEERDDATAIVSPMPCTREDVVGRRLGERVHRAEVPREQLRRRLPDVPDAEPEQQPRQRLLLRCLDRLDQCSALLSAKRSSAASCSAREVVEVGDVVHEAGVR